MCIFSDLNAVYVRRGFLQQTGVPRNGTQTWTIPSWRIMLFNSICPVHACSTAIQLCTYSADPATLSSSPNLLLLSLGITSSP